MVLRNATLVEIAKNIHAGYIESIKNRNLFFIELFFSILPTNSSATNSWSATRD